MTEDVDDNASAFSFSNFHNSSVFDAVKNRLLGMDNDTIEKKETLKLTTFSMKMTSCEGWRGFKFKEK